MSIKASFEIIIQLHNFQNLALPHKGKYALQIEIYQIKHKNRVFHYHLSSNTLSLTTSYNLVLIIKKRHYQDHF